MCLQNAIALSEKSDVVRAAGRCCAVSGGIVFLRLVPKYIETSLG